PLQSGTLVQARGWPPLASSRKAWKRASAVLCCRPRSIICSLVRADFCALEESTVGAVAFVHAGASIADARSATEATAVVMRSAILNPPGTHSAAPARQSYRRVIVARRRSGVR